MFIIKFYIPILIISLVPIRSYLLPIPTVIIGDLAENKWNSYCILDKYSRRKISYVNCLYYNPNTVSL